ncbi:MAG: CtsR family transcriptional regulator [Firmicutes bacterium]|nr:CtsR family transcriptional regulator [Bacillota bacterium]
MGSLSDLIEQYLQDLLAKRESIEIQRRQLAQMFRCAPSQINYVLETRFTLDHGYLIVSRRGGGGYIKIARANWHEDPDLLEQIKELIGAALTQEGMAALLQRLVREGVLEEKDSWLLWQVVNKELENPDFPEEKKDHYRAILLRTALLVLCGREKTIA